MKALVTGASGFVGQALCTRLLTDGHSVTAAVRRRGSAGAQFSEVEIGNIDGTTRWERALEGIDVVFHLAARVHVLEEKAANPAAEFRKTNVEGTATLARAAARAGVSRLVFLSSVKVYGDENRNGAFRDDDPLDPSDDYGQSKVDAEAALRDIAASDGLAVTTLRTPLVYGPHVKANFLKLLDAVYRRYPLPFGRVANKRSLIYLGNLADALVACATHPAAGGETFLVSDGDDVSTAELVRRIAVAFRRAPRLLPIPPSVLIAAATALGRRAAAVRLLGSLTVDSSRIVERLGWTPRYSMAEGLTETARWYEGERIR